MRKRNFVVFLVLFGFEFIDFYVCFIIFLENGVDCLIVMNFVIFNENFLEKNFM